MGTAIAPLKPGDPRYALFTAPPDVCVAGSRSNTALSGSLALSPWQQGGWWKDKVAPESRWGVSPKWKPVYVLDPQLSFVANLRNTQEQVDQGFRNRATDANASRPASAKVRSGSEGPAGAPSRRPASAQPRMKKGDTTTARKYGWTPARQVAVQGEAGSFVGAAPPEKCAPEPSRTLSVGPLTVFCTPQPQP